jgi:hypothetical protein
MAIVQSPTARDDGSQFIDSKSGRSLLTLSPTRGTGFNAAQYIRFYDDFLGDVIADQWNGTAGATGTVPTISTSLANGQVRLSTATTNDTSVLALEVQFLPSNGNIYMEARVSLASITNVCVNIGFTDTKANEIPITISGTTITTNASDAAVLVFDTAQTNDFWHIQGVKANEDTAIFNTGIAPVGGAMAVYGIEIDTAGHATFFINGQQVGVVANAVTPSVRLTPVIAQVARSAAAKNVDVDYVVVQAVRG